MTTITPGYSIPIYERETTIATVEADEWIRVDSAIRRHITAMRKHPAFEEINRVVHGTTEVVTFRVKAVDWNPATGGRRKRNLTEAQRAELSERAKRNRAKQLKQQAKQNKNA